MWSAFQHDRGMFQLEALALLVFAEGSAMSYCAHVFAAGHNVDSIGTHGVLASSAPHREAMMACRLVQAMECGLCEAAAGAGPATGRVGQAATRPGDPFRAPCT